MKVTTARAAACAALGIGALLTGCSSKDSVSASAIRWNLSPELRGIAETPDEGKNALAIYMDTNTRAMWDDIARSFYTDHPSRLSPYPITYTSGNPRCRAGKPRRSPGSRCVTNASAPVVFGPKLHP